MLDKTIQVTPAFTGAGLFAHVSNTFSMDGFYGMGIHLMGDEGDYYLQVSIDGVHWTIYEDIGKKGKIEVVEGELMLLNIVDINVRFGRIVSNEDLNNATIYVARRFNP